MYCAKHNQHATARGVWGHAPQKIFEKQLNLVEFQHKINVATLGIS